MATDYVRCRIDPAIKERATRKLEAKGMNMTDFLRAVVTDIADNGVHEVNEAYEEHIRQAALQALNNPAPKRTTAQVDETIRRLRARLEARTAERQRRSA